MDLTVLTASGDVEVSHIEIQAVYPVKRVFKAAPDHYDFFVVLIVPRVGRYLVLVAIDSINIFQVRVLFARLAIPIKNRVSIADTYR